MTVRAKFKCISKTEDEGNETANISFTAVYDPNPESENGQFFKWTPSATLNMYNLKGTARDAFEQGKEYYLDFTPAD